MHHAKFFLSTPTEVICTLCPHGCHLKNHQRGLCGVRENKDGLLYSLNYAKVSSVALDPIEKKPLYHFYPGSQILSLGTGGCNLKCLHCQNSSISQSCLKKIPLQKLSINELLYLIREEGIEFVAFTYNEPLVWFEYVLEAATHLKNSGVKTVLVTNGYCNPNPLAELLPYIDAHSLDIKWAFDTTAQKLSGVKSATPVFDYARAVFKGGKHLEIVTNLVSGYNDSDQELEAIAQFIAEELSVDIPWHLSRSFPAFKLPDLSSTPTERLEKGKSLGEKYGLKHIYFGNC